MYAWAQKFCRILIITGTAWLSYGMADVWGQNSDPPAEPLLVPERSTKFDVQEGEETRTLFAADPKLIMQTHVAHVAVVFPTRVGRVLDESIPNTTFGPPSSQIHVDFLAGVATLRGRSAQSLQLADFFQQLADRLPEGKGPPAEVLQFFTGRDESGRTTVEPFLQIDGDKRVDRETGASLAIIEFDVFGSSAEEAQARAEGFMQLLEFGVYAPARKRLWEIQKAHAAQIKEKQNNLQMASRKVEELQKQVKDIDPINDQALTDLETQRRILAVDLAGAKARVEVCNKLLNEERAKRQSGEPSGDRNGTAQRIAQIENLKIAAEIELVGLTARLSALEHFVEAGRDYRRISDEIVRTGFDISEIDQAILRLKRMLDGYQEAYKDCQLHVFNNTVTIRPIAWSPRG